MISKFKTSIFKKNNDQANVIIQEIEDIITVYRNFEKDGQPLKHETAGMHEETVINRATISDLLRDLDAIGGSYNTDDLIRIDREWQAWIQKNKTRGFNLVDISSHNYSKNEWWYWIDKLDKLSKMQKATVWVE